MRKQTIKPARLDEGSRVDFDMNNVELEEFTVCVIINPLTGDNTKEFIFLRTHLNGGIIVRLAKNLSKLYGYVSDNNVSLGGYSGNGSIPFGEVTKIAVRFDTTGEQAEYSYFINGIKTHTFTGEKMVPIAFPLSGTGLIGSDTLEVYDFSFHTRALSDTEIKKIYNSSLTIPVSQFKRLGLGDDLLIALALDEENKAVDLSGNGYHGDLINDVTFDGSPVDILHTGLQTQNTLKADGSQYLTGAKVSEAGEDFFFSGFAKFDEFGSTVTVYEARDIGYMQIRNNGSQLFSNYRTESSQYNLSVGYNFTIGEIYHIIQAHNINEATTRLYINGLEVANRSQVGSAKATSDVSIYSALLGSAPLVGSLHNVYFGRKAFGQQGVDWFYNKGVPRDLSIMPSKYANEAISIYEPNLLNGGKDISGNSNDCAIVGTPAYTAVEEVQKISNYQTGL